MPRKNWKEEFALPAGTVPLNHAGQAPLPRRVVERVLRFLAEAQTLETDSEETWNARSEATRRLLARLVGARREEIAFVRNTAEGLSLVAAGLPWREGDNVVVLRGEFPSNVYPWLALESRGVEIRWARLDRGFLAPEELRERIDSRTQLVAATFVDWQFGTRNDLGRLASVCRERDVLFCVDGIQGVGALRIDVENAGVDALSCGGHKWLLAPEGCGFLYVSRRVLERIRPVLLGWKSVRDADTYLPYHFELRDDAAKFEPGSPPHLGIHALGGGVELLLEAGADFVETRILELTDLLVEGLRQRGLRVLSPRGPSLSSGIVTFEPGDDPVRLCEELERRGYIVRPRAGGVRVSPHFYNDEDDIGGFLAALDEVRRR